ncbi:hypothetical protein F5Y19DRAFT_470312 [Xylariaceae sp. FL1651]|nr:hypothetical protein F5Y19DRAFT_470312 [Xylariaceae sp. FL1651]
MATFYEMFEDKYTTMGSRSTLHPRVSRNELSQNMGSVFEPVQEEIREEFLANLLATEANHDPTAPISVLPSLLLSKAFFIS